MNYEWFLSHLLQSLKEKKKRKIEEKINPKPGKIFYIYQGLEGTIALVSSNLVASSSIGILLQTEFLIDKILARSSPLPLKPVILDDIIGITKTEDALIVSSPKPRVNAQEVCK